MLPMQGFVHPLKGNSRALARVIWHSTGSQPPKWRYVALGGNFSRPRRSGPAGCADHVAYRAAGLVGADVDTQDDRTKQIVGSAL